MSFIFRYRHSKIFLNYILLYCNFVFIYTILFDILKFSIVELIGYAERPMSLYVRHTEV